ncbi:MAG: hypothetical protein ACTHZ9_03705 [Leucobacter sp.]
MKRRPIAGAASSILVAGMLGGAGAVAYADDGLSTAPRTTGTSPVVTEFNGGSCSVAPFSTTVEFTAGTPADGGENNGWNGTFAAKTATLGAGIQNWQTGSTMNYRPWVGVAAYDGRTISGATAEFNITAGTEEGAGWAFTSLPAGNAATGSNFTADPSSTNVDTGSFTVDVPTQDGSRAYGHKAGWTVTSSAGANPTDYERSATITVSGGSLSPLAGENNDCQQLFWDGTVQPIFGNGVAGTNGITVNVGSGVDSPISGTITDTNGSTVDGAEVTVANHGAVSVSVPEQVGDHVTVQLTAGETAIGAPFEQPLLAPTHDSTPTEYLSIESGETVTLSAPRDANGQDFPEGTTFAALGAPQLVGAGDPEDAAPRNGFALFAADSDSWATVAEDGRITISAGPDVSAGTYALGVRATLPSSQSDDVTVYFGVAAADVTPTPDEPTESENDSAIGASTADTSTKAQQLASTGTDETTTLMLVLAAIAAVAGGGYLLHRQSKA